MSAAGHIALSLDTEGFDAFLAAFAELPVGILDGLAELLGEYIDGTRDFSDLLRFESVASSASGALKLCSVKILPSNVLLELMAAFAWYREDVSLGFSHGWPVLSLAADTASVAEAAEESILGGGGVA